MPFRQIFFQPMPGLNGLCSRIPPAFVSLKIKMNVEFHNRMFLFVVIHNAYKIINENSFFSSRTMPPHEFRRLEGTKIQILNTNTN